MGQNRFFLNILMRSDAFFHTLKSFFFNNPVWHQKRVLHTLQRPLLAMEIFDYANYYLFLRERTSHKVSNLGCTVGTLWVPCFFIFKRSIVCLTMWELELVWSKMTWYFRLATNDHTPINTKDTVTTYSALPKKNLNWEHSNSWLVICF